MAVTRSARILLVVALVVVAWQSLVPPDSVVVQTSADKVGHGLAYAVLGVLAAFAMRSNRPVPVWGGLVVFGLVIECVQGLGGQRAFEWLDLVADAVGAWAGLALGLWMRTRLARQR